MTKQIAPLPVIVFIDPTKLTLFSQNALGGINVALPAGCIKNMEIVDSESLLKSVCDVVEAQKLKGSIFLFVLSSTLYFEKKILLVSQEKISEEIKKISHSVPFERVATKEFKIPEGLLFISANRDFFDTLRQAFMRTDSQVAGIIPQYVLSLYSTRGTLDQATVAVLLSKFDSLKEHTLVASAVQIKTLQQQEEYISSHYSGAVIAAFIIFLVLVFGVTGFILRRQATSVKKTPIAPPSGEVVATPSAASAAATLLPVVPAETQTNAPKTARIELISTGQSASVSSALSAKLAQSNFEDISSVVRTEITVERPLMLYSATLPAAIRLQILDIAKSILPTITTQETSDLEVDVSIIITNPTQ